MVMKNDGGPAFPTDFHYECETCHTEVIATTPHVGMSLRDWFATFAPEPSNEEIKRQQQHDHAMNPYNDTHKPHLRSVGEIICEIRYQYADAMLKEREKP